MLQFYFLSVLLNVLCGFVLVYAAAKSSARNSAMYSSDDGDDFFNSIDGDTPLPDSETDERLRPFLSFLNDSTFRLVLGAVSMLVGFIKLFYSVRNDIAVLGDLLPALAGLCGGSCLLFDYFDARSEFGLSIPEPLENVIVGGRRYIGLFCIVAGLLHFIFPKVILL